MDRCRAEFDGGFGENHHRTWPVRFPRVGVRRSLLEFLDHRLGLRMADSSGLTLGPTDPTGS